MTKQIGLAKPAYQGTPRAPRSSVPFGQDACFIVNANHCVMWAAAKLRESPCARGWARSESSAPWSCCCSIGPFQAQTVAPQPMNKLRLLTSVTLICIATLLIAIATAKALAQEQEIAKSKCGLKFVNCINSTCAKYKGNDQMQMQCYERCVRVYTECLENAGISRWRLSPTTSALMQSEAAREVLTVTFYLESIRNDW